ncbi:GntR family transcriptional regulator [Ramlibacter rhizophilus]|uniref:GntR family transcriptional regulator n=1 Tax=Ramlibacter rhizophilus TaxID=1781167 RepID=UPI001F0E238F|nr:GntR family transcriptional regulator [Ramlibacter rhizophilus]
MKAPALPASPEPVSEHVYRELRKAIVRCDFEPGTRLRVEELTRRLGVSSSPVREALNRLAEQGIVSTLENRGFRVARLTSDGVADLVRVRLLVECEALSDSIAHGDDSWEAGVVAAAHSLALVERRLGDGPRALDDDWSARHRAFHLSLYAACTSEILRDLVDVLFDRAEHYRRWTAKYRQAPRRKHDEHQKLMAAALARDTEKAVELLRRHIARTGDLVGAVLDGGPPEWIQ